MSNKYLITIALPYANGPLHLGHILEAMQADIYYRHKMQMGHEVLFISGSDAHGTPIMLKANSLGIDPETMVSEIRKSHIKDFQDFFIKFDNYGSSNTKDNEKLVISIYEDLLKQGFIYRKEVEQLYDEERNIFLSDRMIRGECPKCRALAQYGDSCESCGSHYDALELINPVSSLSNTKPVLRRSEHLYLDLNNPEIKSFLISYINKPELILSSARNKLLEWVAEDKNLKSWCISRDAPYFGIKIPNTDKYFYVWMDAPIAYIAFSESIGVDWNKNGSYKLIHFIGKDILYFHSIFWPVLLNFSNRMTPEIIRSHGFLTINKRKMSKSKANFISARAYLDEGLNPEYLRYYFASKLGSNSDDIDFNISEFIDKINADLVGNYINICSRSLGILHKRMDPVLLKYHEVANDDLIIKILSELDYITKKYDDMDYSKIIAKLMQLSGETNKYFSNNAPWNMEAGYKLLNILSVTLYAFFIISFYFEPIIPNTVAKIFELFNITKSRDLNFALNSINKISKYSKLFSRLEDNTVNIVS